MPLYSAGVDVGSTQTKAVVLDEQGRIAGRALTETGAHVVQAAEKAFQAACRAADVPEEDVLYVVGTGYGRYRVTFGNSQVTEISCHARGAAHLYPGTRSVLDMGGQDTKAIRLGPGGEIAALAARHRIPAVYPFRFFAKDGGLISYGADTGDIFRRAAGYVDRVLKGGNPGELPVQMPTKFELVINLAAARALGLELPPMMLARADEVIE